MLKAGTVNVLGASTGSVHEAGTGGVREAGTGSMRGAGTGSVHGAGTGSSVCGSTATGVWQGVSCIYCSAITCDASVADSDLLTPLGAGVEGLHGCCWGKLLALTGCEEWPRKGSMVRESDSC